MKKWVHHCLKNMGNNKRRVFRLFKYLIKPLTQNRLSKLLLLKKSYSFLHSIVIPKSIMVDDMELYLHPYDRELSEKLVLNKNWQKFEIEIILKNINEGDTVLDIGANIGYYTIYIARKVGKNGKVFCFEPDPVNCSFLKKSVIANGYTNVIVEQKAVTDKIGKAKLYLCDENKGDHRIYNSYDDRKNIDIETVTLDDYFKNYKENINFIKIDVQGSEGGVIKGMKNLLKKNKNVKMFIEYEPRCLKLFGTCPDKYLKLITQAGFKFFMLNSKLMLLEPITSSILKKLPIESTNLLCIKAK